MKSAGLLAAGAAGRVSEPAKQAKRARTRRTIVALGLLYARHAFLGRGRSELWDRTPPRAAGFFLFGNPA
jgi:hypothetical protein